MDNNSYNIFRSHKYDTYSTTSFIIYNPDTGKGILNLYKEANSNLFISSQIDPLDYTWELKPGTPYDTLNCINVDNIYPVEGELINIDKMESSAKIFLLKILSINNILEDL